MKFDTKNNNPLAEGGEGYIYEHNGEIIKIFKRHIDLKSKEKKIDMLMRANLPKCVIKPINKVEDNHNNFIGYTMSKVAGEEIKRISNRKFCVVNNIDTKFILKLLIKIKDALSEIHNQNIFIGDLNDQNILFDMSGDIYFIDCDSWSVGSEKCTVAMDLFKDPELIADNFSADTDNYAFMVLAWKTLTRVHPFGGTMTPDIPILKRMSKRLSVIDRNVKIPRTAKGWNGFSPYLMEDFKKVFEKGERDLTDNIEDFYKNLSYCNKDKEYYYSKFSSCPYCDKNAAINKKPSSLGVVNGMHLMAVYDEANINTLFDRYTYLDNNGNVVNGNHTIKYQPNIRYYFLDNGKVIEDKHDCFIIHSNNDYTIDKKYRTPICVAGDNVYFTSPNNVFTKIIITDKGNAIKNICKTSNNVYFSVESDNYCIVNYYSGKLIININGINTEIKYDYSIQNYGLHRDSITGKWMIILENSQGMFNTYVINKNNIDYHTDQIKYECNLSNPCISNSTIFIPIDEKIRGFSYQKSIFKDFECSVVSEESTLKKERSRFVIINLDNVYYLGK